MGLGLAANQQHDSVGARLHFEAVFKKTGQVRFQAAAPKNWAACMLGLGL